MNDIILGAGITGLAAGFKTGFPIYEATDRPGGICRSYYRSGYRFENGGGHWIFGADDDILSFINKYSKLRKYQRNAGVYINKIFPYPIQTYTSRHVTYKLGTMADDMNKRFGNGLCNMFFNPFNEKYTDGLYDSIIPTDTYKSPSIGDKGYNSEFYYPVAGLDDFIDKLAAESEINYKKKVMSINVKDKVVVFEDGESIKYSRIISTLPLNKMIELCGLNAKDLPYTSTLVINIGAEQGPACPKEHWLYVPYCKNNFYRIGFYSNVEQSFSPEGKVSIYVEGHLPISENAVARELSDLGFIGTIEVLDHNYIDVAYTWLYDPKVVNIYLKYLKKCGIESIGRYGAWKFQGIAQSITDGLKVEF